MHNARLVNLLPFIVCLDMLAFSMVIPLLPKRMSDLGMRPTLIGFVGSAYSGAQILGGFIIGRLMDRCILTQQAVLVMSFAGASLSYCILSISNSFIAILVSRVIVGLVKQTITTSNGLITEWMNADERALGFGRIGSATLIGFLGGQSLGGILASRVHVSLPTVASIIVYIVDIVLVLSLLPKTTLQADLQGKRRVSAIHALRGIFADSRATGIVGLIALSDVVSFGLFAMMQQYEQYRYAFSPEQLGYLGTARGVLNLLLQTMVVGRIIRHVGEEHALQASYMLATLAYCADATIGGSRIFYVLAFLPTRSLGSFLCELGMNSLIAQVSVTLGPCTMFAAVDVLHSFCGFIAPTLGGFALDHFGASYYPCIAAALYGSLFLCSVLILPIWQDVRGRAEFPSENTEQAQAHLQGQEQLKNCKRASYDTIRLIRFGDESVEANVPGCDRSNGVATRRLNGKGNATCLLMILKLYLPRA